MSHPLRTAARRIVHITAVSLGLVAALPALAQSVSADQREARSAREARDARDARQARIVRDALPTLDARSVGPAAAARDLDAAAREAHRHRVTRERELDADDDRDLDADTLLRDRALRTWPRDAREAGALSDPLRRPPPLVLTPRDQLEIRRFGSSSENDDGTSLETRVIVRDQDPRQIGERRIGATTINHGVARQPSLQGRQSGSSHTIEAGSFEFRRIWD